MTKTPNKPPAATAPRPAKAPAKTAPEFKGLCAMIEEIMKDTGNEELTAVDRPVPTGLDLLDFYNGRYFRTPDEKGWSLAVGAPEGKMIGLVGYTGTGKTTEAVQMGIAICLPYEGAMVYHFDLERAWSKERTAEICGMTMAETDRRYKRLKKVPLEKIMAFVLNIHLTKIKEGRSNQAMWVTDVETGVRKLIPTVVLIDTVDALDSEIDEETVKSGSALAEAGAQAKANNRAAKRLSGIIGESNITVIWVNHIREKIQTGNTPEAKRIQHIGAKETIPGGHGFPQQSDLLLKLTPVGGALDVDEKMKIPGKVVRHVVVKTRLSYDGRAYNLILTKGGFDNDWSNLAFLASEKLLKGASSYLYLEHNGQQTRKFAMSQYKELINTDAKFREVANGVLLDALTALVPIPGSMEEADVIAAGRALIEAEGISLEDEAADLAAD